MTYYFQWLSTENDERVIKRLKERQGYAGFKLVEGKVGELEGEKILQVKIEWSGDQSERPHPLWKEMIRAGGEIHAYMMD
jgi:hypothetical protein